MPRRAAACLWVFAPPLLLLLKPGAAAPSAPVRYAVTDLGAVAGDYSTARGINGTGEVAGESDGRAFLWRDGKMQDLGLLPGFTGSRATAINNRGEVAGYCHRGREGQAGWA